MSKILIAITLMFSFIAVEANAKPLNQLNIVRGKAVQAIKVSRQRNRQRIVRVVEIQRNRKNNAVRAIRRNVVAVQLGNRLFLLNR